MKREPARVCVLTHRSEPSRPRRAADGLYVCLGHERRIADALAELPGMHHDLVSRHVAGPVASTRISGTPEKRIPYRGDVGDERNLIRSQLASWAGYVIDQRGTGSSVDYLVTVQILADFLGGNLTWLLASDVAKDFADEILERHDHAWRLLYPSGRRRYVVAACVETGCAGQVYAIIRDTDELLPSALVCDTCGLDIPASKWLAYGRKVGT